MKRFNLTFTTLAFLGAALLPQQATAAIPIVHWTQASGARIYLVESPSIPMVDVKIDFDAGARRDPRDKVGLATTTASLASLGVLSKGNQPALDENELGEAWADLGAAFSSGASTDRMSFSMRSLTFPDILPKAVALAARQIGEPSFLPAIWDRNRQRLVASLKEANTQPATLAARAFGAAVYGSHPYGFDVTPESLANITVQDMQALHARAILPCRATVTLVGAITRNQADAMVTSLLSRIAPALTANAQAAACAPWPAVPDIAPLTQAKEERIAFESAQAHVLMGQPGYQRDDPDFFALSVGNYILGGGEFVSRLYNEVREKRGLSYSIDSYFTPALHAGAFTIGLQTRPDQVAAALQVSREVLSQFVSKGPTAAELKAAKNNMVGGFALRIDSNAKLLDNVASIAWNKLPLDYLDTWTQRVSAITLADVKAAFGRKLQPERMVTVVVGGPP